MLKVIEDVRIEPTERDNFVVARFSARIPPKPKATIVLVPPSNGDGRSGIYNSRWARFADRHNVALVGCYLFDKNRQSPAEWYVDAKSGSGQALLTALDQMDLGASPLLLWGFSAGGEFNYEFACWRPDRVKAFIVNKGGFYYTALAPAATRAIKSTWFIGTRDAYYRKEILQGIFDINQVVGSNWQVHHEDVSHVEGCSERVSMELFSTVLQAL